ncbi:1-acyl-sn-glycerol-3-phosphate acyltransferase [Nocardioides sp.]|uniref:lysophospholipid acyltransferase family protein n=1 Tax=Nocardioides sp. TaxID=35761 RepID=UPI00273691B3|nr:lysophospholipid acyltransferase family protein [Nocardioides sp.]MDP3891332.1 lysophospholipid acyltransferase family protein [Nocardioides sp.]
MDSVYAGVNLAGRAAMRALGLQIRVEGATRIPRTGPVVLVSPHTAFVDFPLVELAATEAGRYVRFLTRHDVWHAPGRVVARAMDAMGHVPVDRTAPAAAYLHGRRHLRAGEAVGVFPEAGISTSFTVRALMPGAVALAVETGATLVPLVTWGAQRISRVGGPVDLTRGRPVDVVVGEPRGYVPGTDVRAATRALGGELQRLLDEVQQRPRHRPRPGEWAPWHPAHLGGHAPSAEQARAVESVPRSAVAATWAPRPQRS